MRTVPWSAARFADLTAVAKDIAAAMKITPLGRANTMLGVLLKIALGEWPRPTYIERTTQQHFTSVRQLADLARMSKTYAYEDVEVVAVLNQWLPRLADAPGYVVRVINHEPVARKPIAAMVMTALDRAEREGRLIPMAFNRGASIAGFCEQNDLNFHVVRAHPLAVKLITDASKRPGAAGGKHDPLYQSPGFRADQKAVLDWLGELRRHRRPLPGRPEKPGDVDYEWIEEQAGVKGRPVFMAKAVQVHIKAHRIEFGVAVREQMVFAGPSCSEVKQQIREWYLAEHGSTSLGNAMTALNRIFAARDLRPASEFPRGLFADPVRLQVDAASIAPKLKNPRNLKRQVQVLAGLASRVFDSPSDGLPRSAGAALDFAMKRCGKKATELEAATGIPATLFGLLRTGQQQLPFRFVKCLPALDETLGTGDGMTIRFEPHAVFSPSDCTPLYRSLDYRVRRLLPKGAEKLVDVELLRHVSDVSENAVRQNRMYSKVLAASQTFWAEIPEVPDDARISLELRLLRRHKTMAVPDDANRRAKGAWSKATRQMHLNRLRHFARFLLLDTDRGGAGLSVEDASLAMILNWKVLAAYMEFLSRRYEDVVHDGERRGPLLTVYDLGVLQLAVSLLDKEYGWVQQRSDLFAMRVKSVGGQLGPFPALDELRIRHAGDGEDEVEDIEDTLSAASNAYQEVMPGEIITAANDNWFAACVGARHKITNLNAYLSGLVDPSRSPFEPIQQIIDSSKPLDYLRDIAQAAQNDLPEIALDPIGHATAVRNLLMFVLLSVTALRSKNLRQLLYEPDGRGHVAIKDDQIYIKIPWENFKNLGSWHLFGVPGFKFDYERMVQDWFNVRALFEHYVRKCRPLLISHFRTRLRRDAAIGKLPPADVREDTNALFPIPSLLLMDEHGFGDIIRDMTRRYHVIDPKTGLVRPGYMFFGPHAVRDILAMHIVMGSNDLCRWEEAADLLQTSIAMVQLRYTKRKVIERLAKSDRHFDESSADYKKVSFA